MPLKKKEKKLIYFRLFFIFNKYKCFKKFSAVLFKSEF